jgi:alpha-beta hydrolase superfamily lysophospholipase
MLEAFALARDEASKIEVPTLMLLAGQDKVVNNESTRSVFDALGAKKKQLFHYIDSYHEILNDLDRADALADIKKFINPMLKE